MLTFFVKSGNADSHPFGVVGIGNCQNCSALHFYIFWGDLAFSRNFCLISPNFDPKSLVMVSGQGTKMTQRRGAILWLLLAA